VPGVNCVWTRKGVPDAHTSKESSSLVGFTDYGFRPTITAAIVAEYVAVVALSAYLVLARPRAIRPGACRVTDPRLTSTITWSDDPVVTSRHLGSARWAAERSQGRGTARRARHEKRKLELWNLLLARNVPVRRTGSLASADLVLEHGHECLLAIVDMSERSVERGEVSA
jgi:hypothetical protein